MPRIGRSWKRKAGFQTVGELYNACKFRAALGETLALAWEANGYTFVPLSAGLDRKTPWFQIKEDRQAAATSVYVTRSVRVVDNLETLLAPIPAAHGAATPQVPGLRGPALRHVARDRIPRRNPQPPGADLRPHRRYRHLGAEHAAGRAGVGGASATVQEKVLLDRRFLLQLDATGQHVLDERPHVLQVRMPCQPRQPALVTRRQGLCPVSVGF
jgi:hypothetical protein